ncbi:MAG: hypothetical protein EPN37_00970 [Chitinophagaceae bacterium]|nr:MAG: hypothetical protein EPN37_00970 [Chitinophagaceae bacterium]
MGIREMVLEKAKKEGLETGLKTGLKRGRLKGREEGLEEGLEKGLEKGKEVKSYEVVKNLIERMGMTDAQVADIAGVSVTFVKKVRKRLKK